MTENPGPCALPDYDRPPLVETVVGVQFDEIRSLSTAHLAAFWATLDQQAWPTATDAAPLTPQSERFDELSGWAELVEVRVAQQYPGCRVQIKHRNGDRMIQLQKGRFHLNWLGQAGATYPRYEHVRKEFSDHWAMFLHFVSTKDPHAVRPNQWEVTYVNQIPRGTVWTTPRDFVFFRPLGEIPCLPLEIQSESFGGEWHFVIGPQRGRLHVAWQHGRKENEGPQDPSQEFILLTFTARGPVASQDDPTAALLEGLDLGRESIVRSFQQLMSDSANQHWGLKNA
jgi:uncharacterized protein (TIGR04255 family)